MLATILFVCYFHEPSTANHQAAYEARIRLHFRDNTMVTAHTIQTKLLVTNIDTFIII